MLTFLIIQRYLYSRVRFLLIPLGTASTVYSVHDQWLLLLFLVGDRLIVLNRCLLILKRSWWFVLGWSVWYFSMFLKITCSFCINVFFTLSAAHTSTLTSQFIDLSYKSWMSIITQAKSQNITFTTSKTFPSGCKSFARKAREGAIGHARESSNYGQLLLYQVQLHTEQYYVPDTRSSKTDSQTNGRTESNHNYSCLL